MLDRFYRRRYKILGGPGCGKTTKILDILADYIKGGINLDQVLLIGFAKATVQELQARVIKKGFHKTVAAAGRWYFARRSRGHKEGCRAASREDAPET